MKLKDLSIYIHIPFCVKKCLYCDFLSFAQTEDKQCEYISALIKEIKAFKNKKEYLVQTIFIGGGTPSSINAEYIKELLESIKEEFILSEKCEITMEANPATFDRKKAEIYKLSGVNRISLGLQAVQDRLLKRLGRIHSFQEFKAGFQILREAGFDNINVDLMFALPEQSLEDWRDSLLTVAELSPEHISAYSLIIEEGTPFYKEAELNPNFYTSEENDRQMYYMTKEILEGFGYQRYEISNYAKAGFNSRHNTVYWKRGEYIGFGLGASSFMNDTRFKNTCDFEKYIGGSAYEEIEEIKGRTAYSEFMFLGLRMTEGVSISQFQGCFGISIFDVYGEQIDKHLKSKLLIQNGDRLYLSEKGIDVSNSIFVDFI